MGTGRRSLTNQGGPQGSGEGVSLLQAVVWGSGKRLGSGADVPHFPREAGLARGSSQARAWELREKLGA